MATQSDLVELQSHLGDMVLVERQMVTLVGEFVSPVGGHPEVAKTIERYHRMAKTQHEASEVRLRSIGGQTPSSPTRIAPVPVLTPVDAGQAGTGKALSRTLHVLATAFNHAAFGYAILHSVAHRFYDSQASGNTADLAEAHMRGYAAAAQEINQMISDAVVSELSLRGQECQCQCPSCALGICLCAPHGTNTVTEVWQDTRPTTPSGGIRVRLPRGDSVVARVGLREGDCVVAVDDQQIASDLDASAMQAAVRRHESGGTVRLRVHRATEDLDVSVTRP